MSSLVIHDCSCANGGFRARAIAATSLPLFAIDRILTLKTSFKIPTWVILPMILLAILTTSSTVILRTRGELQASSQQYSQVESEIEILRRDNALLAIEISRMTNDPATIESTARSRLGMVRPGDIVVPVKALELGNLCNLSFSR